ncbi:hypothetical protein [Bifidobacterium catenulatum]|uniref:hypothetical protein n=1 Tax=Bifidobacterium catenulatum TaxID=1686 RepID=UPI002647752E|nr:hypothetical protein [Bifidobacterium catenulatum]WJO87000.1 hypothetical protein K1T30_007090 [Bifidobacterium catenulatum]
MRILGILLAIYAACTLLGFIRQALFAVTIGRQHGHCSICYGIKATIILPFD